MKFSNLLVPLSLVSIIASQPVPGIETVFVTKIATIFVSELEKLGKHLHTAVHPVATSSFPVTETQPVSLPTEESSNSSATSVSFEETVGSSPITAFSGYSLETAKTTAPEASTSTSSSTSESTSGSFKGKGTFYSTGLGACGKVNKDTDHIVAVSQELYDKYTPNGNSNNNSLCGKKITAHYEGKSVDVTVVDSCVGCLYYDLDFSPSAFSELADQDLGRIDITWNWSD